jgi:uncharacterized membrane protein YtjA (UPF0391 family)
MLSWALTFLIFSLVAALFGFSGIASTSAGVAQVLFYIFVGLFLLSLVTGMFRRGDRLIK